MSLHSQKRRALALVVALSLGAAACGSGDESTTPTLATDGVAPQVDGADAGAGDEMVEGDAVDDESADDGAIGPEPEAGSDDESAADEALAVENLFPDIDVLNIADGSTVNLAAELGGGDKATLLWFWAPH